MGATFYSQVLQSFDWAAVKAEAEADGMYDAEADSIIGRCYLGTVFSVMPSGKYYTPFACSNVTGAEADRDERYGIALEKAADKYGGWIESGEGDPCDMFFGFQSEAAT